MKKYLLIPCLAFVFIANDLYSEKVTAFMTYGTFSTPAKGSYIETYISVMGYSLKFVKSPNGKFQGTVDISVAFKLKGEIKNAQKYSLSSPETADTTSGFPNFIDQQRYTLPNGNYEMELSIADKNKPSEQAFVTTVPVTIDFPANIMGVSSIQLLESYVKAPTPSILTKSGFDLTPYVSNYYPENITRMKFYTEMYGGKKILGDSARMIVSYYLESFESKEKLSNFSGFNKQTANEVNILLSEFNIESLPSGNYNLVVEVRDKENQIQAQQKTFFQRTNKPVALSFEDIKSITVTNTFVIYYKNVDSMGYYIKTLRPISNSSEIQFAENQMNGKDLTLMQQYFYNFWKARNSVTPERVWLDYYKEVQKVNKEFGTYGLKGFDTDRGRVYLQYGPPDQRSKYETEPSSYPYEIWEYYSLVDKSQIVTNPNNKQSSKKFIFMNSDLVTNKYVLIHSEARGEIINTRWRLLLRKRDTQSNDFDKEDAPEHYGGNAEDNFNNPR